MLNLLQPFDETPEALIEKLKSPQSSDEFYLVGLAFDLLGKNPNAENMFRMALQTNMRHVPSLYGLSLKSFQAAREQDGQKWLTRALRFDTNAEENVIRFQKELKAVIPLYQKSAQWRLWSLQQLEASKKDGPESKFELARLLFEQSQFSAALPYFRSLLSVKKHSREAAEYLSFALETIYRGEELLDKVLEVAAEVPNRSDLFFNLAMVCQHDQRRLDLALHFFYLASQEDPNDPGLRFSLEQVAMDIISEGPKKKSPAILMMFAHFYQGSHGVAKKYAKELREFGPEVLSSRMPKALWNNWLSADKGIGEVLVAWFA
ncbi:MAG: hypothetical protein JWQ35_2236 [Bacteriovoracaceae bacterium]|nr:hypothetical protein [Bacteriovoracaceae bacterium]